MPVVNDTWYHDETAIEVISLLEMCRLNNRRIKFRYGYTAGSLAGQDWGDDMDTCGYVSRSTGPHKVPIVLYNKRSTGGGHIMDHRIIKILLTRGDKVLYMHPNYRPPTADANTAPIEPSDSSNPSTGLTTP